MITQPSCNDGCVEHGVENDLFGARLGGASNREVPIEPVAQCTPAVAALALVSEVRRQQVATVDALTMTKLPHGLHEPGE